MGIGAPSQCSVCINKHCDSNNNTNSRWELEHQVSVQCASTNTATLMKKLIAGRNCNTESVYISKHCDSNENTNITLIEGGN
ncbi:hypothetical protein J6590_068773 [Homalodisca vitripennis]|nr:hypothetical protein J6590_068773 [Homalodisca vitripennis]